MWVDFDSCQSCHSTRYRKYESKHQRANVQKVSRSDFSNPFVDASQTTCIFPINSNYFQLQLSGVVAPAGEGDEREREAGKKLKNADKHTGKKRLCSRGTSWCKSPSRALIPAFVSPARTAAGSHERPRVSSHFIGMPLDLSVGWSRSRLNAS